MKSNVTVEELNAATILLAGVPVTQLVEVHIVGSNVTVVSADQGGNLAVNRIAIGDPVPPTPQPEPEAEEVVDGEVLEESDEDDGT